MARTLLDYFVSEPAKPLPKTEVKTEAAAARAREHSGKSKRKENAERFRLLRPQNCQPSYFVSASYDGRQKKPSSNFTSPSQANSTSGTTTRDTNPTA